MALINSAKPSYRRYSQVISAAETRPTQGEATLLRIRDHLAATGSNAAKRAKVYHIFTQGTRKPTCISLESDAADCAF